MENFIYGLSAFAYSIRLTILSLLRHQLIWGFAIGFFVSTIIHLFVATDAPRTIPTIITKRPEESFTKFAARSPEGTYLSSFTAFQKEYNRVRVVFYSMLLALLLVILTLLIRF